RSRPGIKALIALELGLGLFAALADQVEERIIEALHHDGEGFFLGPGGTGQQRQRAGKRREHHRLAHEFLPVAFTSVATAKAWSAGSWFSVIELSRLITDLAS